MQAPCGSELGTDPSARCMCCSEAGRLSQKWGEGGGTITDVAPPILAFFLQAGKMETQKNEAICPKSPFVSGGLGFKPGPLFCLQN